MRKGEMKMGLRMCGGREGCAMKGRWKRIAKILIVVKSEGDSKVETVIG
jgi:hypothetical protein